MPTIYVSDPAAKGLDEVRDWLKDQTGLEYDYTTAVLTLMRHWNQEEIKVLGSEPEKDQKTPDTILAVIMTPNAPSPDWQIIAASAIAALDLEKIPTPPGTKAMILPDDRDGIPRGSMVLVKARSPDDPAWEEM